MARSHRLSGIGAPPTVAEIAAYRGLFALERIAVGNLAVFLHHVVGPGAAWDRTDPLLEACLLDLNRPDLDIELWFDRFLARRPLQDGNRRCARALRRWYELRHEEADVVPPAGDIGVEPSFPTARERRSP